MKKIIIAFSLFLAMNTVGLAQNVKETATKTEIQETTYTCPMHPKEMSIKEGECSKCGMKLVKTTKMIHNPAIKGSQSSSEITAKYVCTMGCATSDKPGNCPKCGMDMTPVEGAKKAEKHHH